MATTIEELRTALIWDTTSVEAGAAKYEKAMDRVAKADKATRDKIEQAKKPVTGGGNAGVHGSSSNTVAGIRDLAEGRTMNALTRLTHGMRATGAAAAFAFTAYKIGKSAIKEVTDEMVRTDTVADRLRDSLLKTSRAAAFSTVGDSTETLGGRIEELQEQQKSERAQQTDLADLREKTDGSGPFGNALSHAIYGGIDKVRSWAIFGGHQTTEEKERESALRERVAFGEANRLRTQRTQALGMETDVAQAGLDGDKERVELLRIQREELKEIAALRKAGASEEDIEIVKRKFEIEREAAAKARSDRMIELGLAESIAYVRAKGQNVEVRTAEQRLAAAQDHFNNAGTSPEEKLAAKNRVEDAKEDLRKAQQNEAERDVREGIAFTKANLRGNAEANSQREAELDILAAKELAKLAYTDVEKKQAALALAEAERRQEELRMQIAIKRIGFEKENRDQERNFTLHARTAIASPQASELAKAQADVDAARDAVYFAQRKRAEEKNSPESIQAVKRAEMGVADALAAQEAIRFRIRRERDDELRQAQNQTDALRLQAAGWVTLSKVASERAESEEAIRRALREQKGELAQQLALQQKLREREEIHEKYLKPDGRRRSLFAVHAEERKERQRAQRIGRFDAELDRNGGLMNVHRDIAGRIIDGEDPLTHQRVSPEDYSARVIRLNHENDSQKAPTAAHLEELIGWAKAIVENTDNIPSKR